MKKRQIHPLLSILLALSLMFGLLAAPISAITKSGMGPQAVIVDNMLTGFEMSYNNKAGEWTTVSNGDEVEVDLADANSVMLNYELKRPEGVEVGEGDTYVIDLPSFYEGTATDQPVTINGTEVATYSIINGQIVITFTDNAKEFDDAEMNVSLTGNFNTEIFEDVEEVEVNVPFSDGSEYNVTVTGKPAGFTGEDKKTAGFQYVLEGEDKVPVDRNPEYIDWNVLANDSMETISEATVIDDLGANLEIVRGSVKAYRIMRNYKHEEIGREEIVITEAMLDYTAGGFELDLGAIEDACEITYTTKLNRPDGGGEHKINNSARVILDGKETEVSDDFTGTWSGDLGLISKNGNATEDPHVLNWEVKYNYAKADLGLVNLSDNLSNGEFILGSVKVYEVDVDLDGNITRQEEVSVTPTLEDGTLTIPNLDADGKAYYITYSSTVPVGQNETISNTVIDDAEDPNTDSGSVPVNTIPTGGKVGEQSVDENGRPYIDWKITLNSTKINVGSITIRDVFRPEYLEFNVDDDSLFTLYKNGVKADNFNISYYEHLVDGEPDGRTGFKLDVYDAGPHTYEFVYRTYYTELGMQQPNLANHAELVFLDGEGEGIGDPMPVPDAVLTGPKAGIEKDGDYVLNETTGNQEIEWSVVVNESKIALDSGSKIKEKFSSGNFSYIVDSLTITDHENNVLVLGTDYSFAQHVDESDFVVTLLNTTSATLTLKFRTTVDDSSNLEQANSVELEWQGGTEEKVKSVPKRDVDGYKLGEVVINDDGSKSVKWTVVFNTGKNVIGNFKLTDTYTPTTVDVSDIKIMSDSIDVTGDFTISPERTGGSFTVEKNRLDAREYSLTYTTTLSPAEEQQTISNTAAVTYTGGEGSVSKTLPNPSLGVEKEANSIDRSGTLPVINWTIYANTDSDNKFVNLRDAVLEDTIPGDQRLIASSIKVTCVNNPTVLMPSTGMDWDDNWFKLELPDGPHQYMITYQTEILQMPSLDGEVFDKYNNAVKLTNQTKNNSLKQEASDNAWIRYYDSRPNDLSAKTGVQNSDTEDIDYVLTINPEALTIHNAKIKDTLYSDERYKFHEYLDDSIKLFDENGVVVTEGFTLTVAKDKHSFEISFVTESNKTGTIDSKYTIRYSTRLRSDLVGTYQVVNNIVLTGGTVETELHKTTTTTRAQQWFYGGGGSGRTVRLEINKFNNQVAEPGPGPIENAIFKLERVNLDGTYTTVDAEIGTDTNGIIVKDVLRAGRYKLTELSTPNLYRKLSQPVYFLIGYTDPDDYVLDGEVVTNPHTITITNSVWNASDHSHAEAEDDVLTITNDYKPVLVSLEAEKNLTGQALWNNQFSFGLFDSTGKEVTVARNNAEGKVTFAAQSFGNTGTYTYTISELDTGQGGMDYDDAVFNVTVVVSEGTDGLVAVVTYTDANDDAVTLPDFNNVYTANGNWTPEVTKNLDAGGRKLKVNEFNFKLVPVDGAPMPTGASELLASNDADGKVVFETIPYTETDIGRTYQYDIIEVVTNAETSMTYDTKTVRYSVLVNDNRNGTLRFSQTVVEGSSAVFNNSYEADGSYTIPTLNKELANLPLAAEDFTFILQPVGEATMPLGENGALDQLLAVNTADGKITFDTELTYTQEDIGKTHYYTITEEVGDKGGIYYDPLVVTLKVVVEDLGNGKLSAGGSFVPADGQDEADTTFNNIYTANGKWIPTFSKVLAAGGRQLKDGDFDFELTPVGNAKMPTDVNNVPLTNLTATNDAQGKVIFEAIPYTHEDDGATYRYKIVEVNGGETGMSYDPMEIFIDVAVTDLLNGELGLAVTILNSDDPVADTVFNNSYEASGEWTPEVSKNLAAGERDLLPNEFDFVLTPVDGAPMPKDSNDESLSELTSKNDADGDVVFASIPYTEADIGKTYYYEIVEVKGDEDGMTYDEMTVRYKVVITDAGNGKLNFYATVEGSGDSEFNNIYKATGEWTPEVSKKLAAGGRKLQAGEFNFKLTPVGNATMPASANELFASNDSDGKVVFATIPYTEADIDQTYYYEIVEVAGKEKGMSYDSMTVRVKVVITDDGDGVLKVVYSVEGDNPDTEFNNTYQASGDWTPVVSKKLAAGGRILLADEFNFKLTPVDGSPMPEDAKELLASNDVGGKVTFANIPYSEVNIGETYYYEIVEVAGKEKNMSYDPMTVTVKVVIADAGDGEINVDAKVEGSGDSEFNNSYVASGSYTAEVGKELSGRKLFDGEFNFRLIPVADATMPKDDDNEPLTELTAVNIDGRVVFDEIPYTEADIGKNYTYKITELRGTEGSITYDPLVVTLEVAITDGSNGELIVEAIYVPAEGSDEADTVFNNEYHSDGSWVPTFSKILDSGGRQLQDGEFNFELTPVGNAKMPMDVNNVPLKKLTAMNDAEGKVIFEAIPYTQDDAGATYRYMVVELAGDEKGMSYDPMKIFIDVAITDLLNGELDLEITIVEQEGQVADTEFNNTYVATGEWTPEVSKDLTAGMRELLANEFNFRLTPKGNATMPTGFNALHASNDAEGKVVFDTIPYTEADIGQTYYYEIVEVAGDEKGMTYDEMTVTYKVVITDDGDGVLNVETTVEGAGDTEFNNTYVASGEWTPEVSKVLTAGGRELRANEFNFKLTPVGDATMPEGADELLERNRLDGKVVFATIPYTEADINQTYFYDIVEVTGEEKGMSYDSMIVRVKVVITDAGGGVLNVVQTVEGETGDTEFNNIYNATGEWTPEVSKDLESGGRDLLANEFNFKLTPVGNATMPTGASELLASNDAEGRVVFATIPYTEADIGQTYHYEIVEVAGPETGMTYDQMTVTVRVEITDAGDGVLDVVTTVEGEEADSVFNNIYNASGVWTPEVSKKLAAGGRGLLANEFNFKLTPVGEATMPTGANELLASNDADGQVVFDTIPYTEADIGRTYYYEVVEVPGGEIGMTYDSMKVTYKVVITDAREGKLNVDATVVTVEGETGDTEFNNTYVALGSYTAEVGKELSGRELFDEEFNFRLIPVDDATMPVGEDNEPLAELTAVNIDGKVLFDTIPYTEDDIGQTHTYLITELAGTEGSITYDPLVITLEVAITDGRNGELIVDETYVPVEGAEVADTVFSNEYHADGSWTPTVSKQLLAGGRELQEDEFVFELYLLEADGETWTLLQTASNAADGGVVFEPVSYSELDVDQEYSYKIVERAATEAGMSYSDLEVTIQVSVTDPELLGELEVTTEYSEDRLFINTYEAEGSFAPELTKDLLGRDLAADEFSFTLVPVDGAPLPLDETGEPLNELTATNAADGKIVFADIAYTEADIGQTYTYLITELAGELGGVAYSEQEIVLTVNISDAGNGVVAISTLYTDDATFTNTYTVDPIEVVLEAEKQLKGQDLKAGQFEFELLDENGEVLETVKNAADGKVVFSAIEYNGAGEYNYVIREIKGSEPGYIYDESEYRVVVSVTDHGDGTITAEVDYLDGDAVLVNAYEALAATGESRSILQSLGAVLVALGAALLIQRSRRNRKKLAAK